MTSWQAFHFDSVDSTNETAKRLIQTNAIHGRAYVLAREQTAGRGHRGRVWLSPRDAGIYLTIVDFPNALPTPVTNLFTLGAGIACVEALRQCTGVDVHLKPINDLYAGHAKLGGILTEAVIEGEHIKALLTGVGINVRRTPRLLPAESPEPICLQDLIPPAQFGVSMRV
jgi:BirA family biotin operon repressor/biotin-[acetyl-CoA-carboxylase] ligase